MAEKLHGVSRRPDPSGNGCKIWNQGRRLDLDRIASRPHPAKGQTVPRHPEGSVDDHRQLVLSRNGRQRVSRNLHFKPQCADKQRPSGSDVRLSRLTCLLCKAYPCKPEELQEAVFHTEEMGFVPTFQEQVGVHQHDCSGSILESDNASFSSDIFTAVTHKCFEGA